MVRLFFLWTRSGSEVRGRTGMKGWVWSCLPNFHIRIRTAYAGRDSKQYCQLLLQPQVFFMTRFASDIPRGELSIPILPCW